ncbi:MAG TPA: hypothetical protein VH395_08935 [Jatrophihabitantaceae bacterium]|jgi:hypothetical protein
MNRTPEQVAADDALRDAVIADDLAYRNVETPPLLLTHYIVVEASVPIDDDDSTVIGVMYSDGSMPTWQAIGLLDLARNKLIHDWVSSHEYGGDHDQ